MAASRLDSEEPDVNQKPARFAPYNDGAAPMAESVDAAALKPAAERRAGSSPRRGISRNRGSARGFCDAAGRRPLDPLVSACLHRQEEFMRSVPSQIHGLPPGAPRSRWPPRSARR